MMSSFIHKLMAFGLTGAVILGVTTPLPAEAIQGFCDISGIQTSKEISDETDPLHSLLFPVLQESKLSPVWQEVNQYVYDKVESDTPSRIFIDPVSAFGFDMTSESREGLLSPGAPVYDLSLILVLPEIPERGTFKLTKQSLTELKLEGISEELIEDLEFLEDQDFSEEDNFLDAVEKQIGEKQIALYKERILKHASENKSGSAIRLVNTLEDTTFRYMLYDPQRTFESWDSVLYYSKKFKRAVAHQDEQKPKIDSTVSSDDEDMLYDVLKFFKKWGVPTPFAVILGIIVLYVMLALLSWILSKDR